MIEFTTHLLDIFLNIFIDKNEPTYDKLEDCIYWGFTSKVDVYPNFKKNNAVFLHTF